MIKKDFLEISKIYQNKKKPLYCLTELTNQCNLNCIHCYIDQSESIFLDTDIFCKNVLELKKLGCFKIALTGGECLLHPDIYFILDYLNKNEMFFSIFTNGNLLDKNVINKIKNYKFLENIHLTLFGLEKKFHESITNIKGSLKKTLSAIELLKQNNLSFVVKTVILKQNYENCEELNNYFKKNNIDNAWEFTLFPKENGGTNNLIHMLNNQQLKDINSKFMSIDNIDIDACNKNNSKFNDRALCAAGFHKVVISYNGNVYPCVNLRYKLGNIYNNSIADIWNTSKNLKYLRSLKLKDIKKCSDCSNGFFCNFRCPGISYGLYKDLLHKPATRCRLAKIRKETYYEKQKEKKIC